MVEKNTSQSIIETLGYCARVRQLGKMKYFLVFSSIVALTSALDKKFAQDFMDTIKEVGMRCSRQVGATPDDIATLLSHKVPDTDTGKCLIFCIHKNFKIQNEDGSFDKEAAYKFLEPVRVADADIHNKLEEVFDICFDRITVDSNPCITAANFVNCVLPEAKARGIDESLLE